MKMFKNLYPEDEKIRQRVFKVIESLES